MWMAGEPAVSKIIRITVAEDAPVKIESVVSDDPGVKVQMAKLRAGKEVRGAGHSGRHQTTDRWQP